MFACVVERVCVANVVLDILSHVFLVQYNQESIGICSDGDWARLLS